MRTHHLSQGIKHQNPKKIQEVVVKKRNLTFGSQKPEWREVAHLFFLISFQRWLESPTVKVLEITWDRVKIREENGHSS